MQIFVFQSIDEDVGDHTVLIQNDCIGVSVAAAKCSVVNTVEAFAVVHGKLDVGVAVILCDECGGGISYGGSMDGDHINGIGVVCGDLVEIGKFLDTGTTPCSPEVDHGDLSGGRGVNAFIQNAGSVDTLQFIAVTGVTHFAANFRLGEGGGGVPVVADDTD